MRYADASRVSSFLRQLVVANDVLPSDVVFFFHSFFRPRTLPGFFWLEYQGLMVHVGKDDEDETGGAEGVWGLV